MKKLFILLSFAIMCLVTTVQAQRWPFGAANDIAITPTNDTIIITDELVRGINYVSYSTDTATVLQATNLSTELKIGDVVYFEVSNTGADNETVTFSTGFTGAAVTVTAVKKQIMGFIYNGTALMKFLSTQVD